VSTELLQTLLYSLEEELPQALTLRERLHATPEPSHGEHVTAGLVAKALGAHSVERVARQGRR
jgi:metal-dependent amidase/aminoacylase/carboxypeptidase family protein